MRSAALVSPAAACDYDPSGIGSLESRIAEQKIIFIGTVIERSPDDEVSFPKKIIFRIEKPIRGVNGSTYELVLEPPASDCDFFHEFRKGERWLFAGPNSEFDGSIRMSNDEYYNMEFEQ